MALFDALAPSAIDLGRGRMKLRHLALDFA